MLKKKWMVGAVMSCLALVLALVGVWLFGNPTAVSAAESLETVTDASAQPGLLGEGYLNHGGPGFRLGNGGDIDYVELLANALGITVEELEAAHESAREDAIAQAVEEGLITQEQADRMLVWGGRFGFPGARGRMPGHAGGINIDEEALLADALGITTDEFQAAREEAREAAIAQAVEEGIITQEQADEMARRRTLQEDYMNREALLAEALGMTVEELEAARAEGQTLSDLLEARGLDATTVRDRLEEAHEAALEQAVADGILTQDEADEMQFGFGRMPGARMRGGQGGRRGRGMMPGGPGMPGGPDGCPGFDDRAPGAPGADDSTDTGFGRRGGFAPPIEGSDL